MDDNQKEQLRQAIGVLFLNRTPDHEVLGFDYYRSVDPQDVKEKCATILYNAMSGDNEWRI